MDNLLCFVAGVHFGVYVYHNYDKLQAYRQVLLGSLIPAKPSPVTQEVQWMLKQMREDTVDARSDDDSQSDAEEPSKFDGLHLIH